MSLTISQHLTEKENNFDFIRFASAAIVILSHCYHLTLSPTEPLSAFTNNKYEMGHLCIGSFFLISGFLITRSYIRNPSLLHYFTSRVLRIYPGLIFLILLTVFIIGPLLTNKQVAGYFTDVTTFSYLLNCFAVTTKFTLPGVFENNFHPYVINASLWTLPNEIACYLLVAVAGLLFARKLYSGLALFALTCILFYSKFRYEVDTFYVQLLFFISGSVIYMYRNNIRLNKYLFIISGLALTFILKYSGSIHEGMLSKVMVTVIKSISLSYFIICLSFFKIKYLSNFARYGDFSYGLYIWGYPVQQIICQKFPGISTLSLFLISFPLTLCISILSWHFIEKKFLQFKSLNFNKTKTDMSTSSLSSNHSTYKHTTNT